MVIPVASAVPVTIQTPGGSVVVDISHAGPQGELVNPEPPTDAGFRPPTIFAAPLPVGSGARAWGHAGAFTAVADDATAASWNPAGLVQLEAPEVSAVYRFSDRKDLHASERSNLEVGANSYSSHELNYLSGVYPFRFDGLNTVISLSYQEAYDYTYVFTAQFSGANTGDLNTTVNNIFTETQTNVHDGAFVDITIISDVVTETQSQVSQALNSSLLSTLDFHQSGTIDAISPAFAVELTPTLSMGAAINFYTDGESRGNPVMSKLHAHYTGTSDSMATIVDTRKSTAHIRWSGTMISGDADAPVIEPIAQTEIQQFSEDSHSTREDPYTVEGNYYEYNRTEDFFGINPTLGALWVASDRLTLGVALDLPWSGKGTQTKHVQHEVTTFNSNGVAVATDTFESKESSEVTYSFPLYWSAGALWRWTDRLYTSMDVSQTRWSMYSYKAEGETAINPLNSEPHESSKLDDCWSVRVGGEYLWMLSWTELPVRGGLFWEERPSIGSPDQYWGFSLGSGLSLGKEPGRAILDIAYIFEQGNDVMEALLPDRTTYSDSTKHQIFMSLIWHF